MSNKFIYITLTILLLSGCGSAGRLSTRSDVPLIPLYKGLSQDGSYLVLASGAGGTPEAALGNAKYLAVRQVLFNGLSSASDASVLTMRPIVSDPAVERNNAAYFASFFAPRGAFLEYVSIPSGETFLPIREGSAYKVKVHLIIYKDKLRKRLEADGIIKSLSDGM